MVRMKVAKSELTFSIPTFAKIAVSAAKIADLLQPGQVILRLAIAGFGVTLPPPDHPVDPVVDR